MNKSLYNNFKKGIIHIGAHKGEEREYYKNIGLNVLWIEAIPSVFEKLEKNIKGYEKQECINQLISDVDKKEYTFHVSSQTSRSSLLKFTDHHHSDPHFYHKEDIVLTSKRMDTLIKEFDIDMNKFDAVVTDCQGADYFVLNSFGDYLSNIDFINSEVMVKEIYEGAKTEEHINKLLKNKGFNKITNKPYIIKGSQRDNFYVRQ
jgi:FkbM family methyltransferase